MAKRNASWNEVREARCNVLATEIINRTHSTNPDEAVNMENLLFDLAVRGLSDYIQNRVQTLKLDEGEPRIKWVEALTVDAIGSVTRDTHESLNEAILDAVMAGKMPKDIAKVLMTRGKLEEKRAALAKITASDEG